MLRAGAIRVGVDSRSKYTEEVTLTTCWLTFCDPSRGKFEDRVNLYGPLPWTRIPLAIRVFQRQRPDSAFTA